jgi:hypothetical protein
MEQQRPEEAQQKPKRNVLKVSEGALSYNGKYFGEFLFTKNK